MRNVIPRLMLLLILVLPLSSAGEESFDPEKDCHASFWDEDAEPAVKAPPEGFTEALVLDALGVTGGVCGWAVKAIGKRCERPARRRSDRDPDDLGGEDRRLLRLREIDRVLQRPRGSRRLEDRLSVKR